MLILNIKERCPYGKICPNKDDRESETGKCDGLNPKRTTMFTCELVDKDGNIEVIGYLNKERNKTVNCKS